MKKKIVSVLLASLMVTSMLAGCGNSSGSSSSSGAGSTGGDTTSASGTEAGDTGLTAEEQEAVDEGIIQLDGTLPIIKDPAKFEEKYGKISALIVNSADRTVARYKAMGLVDYNKYTITNAIERDVELPTIGGFIPVVSDRFTVDTSTDVPIYKSYMIGSGTVLTCDKTNYEDPYYADYDPESKAGIRKLYTKQGYVLHPNGFSINANRITKESPTNAELGAKANWSLAFNHKNIRMGLIKSNG